MIVCVCHRVSDREIARHAADGMDFSEIQRTLRVATQCGRCADCARGIVNQSSSTQPDVRHGQLASWSLSRQPA